MVQVTFFRNPSQQLIGFDCTGHADFADSGDIVCAGISALVITCINSVEALTEDVFSCDSNRETGSIRFRLEEPLGEKSQLLLQSLALGLEEMEDSYTDNLDLIFEEVQET